MKSVPGHLDKLIEWVCTNSEIDQEQLLHKARNNELSKAKALICYWGTDELGLTTTELGKRLALSQQAVSKWIQKGRILTKNSNIEFPSKEA